MTLEQQYSKAMYDLVLQSPEKGMTYLSNLKLVLAAKGHERVYPRIYTEFLKLVEREQRTKKYQEEADAAQPTRTLLELYRTLVQ